MPDVIFVDNNIPMIIFLREMYVKLYEIIVTPKNNTDKTVAYPKRLNSVYP